MTGEGVKSRKGGRKEWERRSGSGGNFCSKFLLVPVCPFQRWRSFFYGVGSFLSIDPIAVGEIWLSAFFGARDLFFDVYTTQKSLWEIGKYLAGHLELFEALCRGRLGYMASFIP